MKKKIISLILAFAMLITFVPTVLGAQGDVITSLTAKDGVVTIDGVGEKNEAISIFLLNPQKTVAELNATEADTADFKAIVNYTDVVYTDKSKLFKTTFEINNFDEDEKYVLYVKTESEKEETLTIGTINVYVDQNTTSSVANGTKEHPFATIQDAKAYVRTLPRTNPINVIIAGGEYKVYEQITFRGSATGSTTNVGDSGTESAPITYKAKDGEKVVLSGAKALDVSKFRTVTKDSAIYNRLPAAAKGKVVEIDLREQGIPESVADYMGAHVGRKRVVPMGVYLNDDQQQISQWPNTGALTIDKASATKGPSDECADKETTPKATFKINGVSSAKAAQWQNAKDMYVDGNLKRGWSAESAPVASISADGTFTLKTFTQAGVINTADTEPQNTRVVIKNLLEEIDVPGEWYVDADAMKMYYYAPYTLTSEDKFEIAVLEGSFAWLEYCNNITFDGIEFTKGVANPFSNDTFVVKAAINTLFNIENITIKNCTFKNLGGAGMFLINLKNVTIDNNKILNTGWTGLEVYGSSANAPKSCGVVISNNHISDFGKYNFHMDAPGIRMRTGHGIVVKNNTIHNGAIGGIMHEYSGHTIKNNEIYNVLKETTDAGAIYNGGSFVNYGINVEKNFLHDIGGVHAEIPENTETIAGIYLDDMFSGGNLKGNIIDMSNDPYSYGVMACGGTDHIIEGNITVNAKRGISVTSRPLTQNTKNYETDLYPSRYFATFLEATDYSSTKDYDGSGTVDSADSLWAVKNIGKSGGPVWKSYLDDEPYSKIKTNYNNLMNKSFVRTTAVVNNAYSNCTEAGVSESDNMIDVESNNVPTNAFVNVNDGDYRLKASDAPAGTFTDETPLTSVGSTLTISEEEKEFDLVYPANESNITSTKTYLKWQASAYADEYEYAVYTNANLTDTPVIKGTTEDNFAEITGLSANTTYYWTVTAKSKSRIINKESKMANQSYSFTVSDYIFENARYDAASLAINVDAKNIGADKTIMLVGVVKVGTEMKAAALLNNVNFANGFDNTITVDAISLTNALTLEGATLELYVWETNMKPLKNKIPISF